MPVNTRQLLFKTKSDTMNISHLSTIIVHILISICYFLLGGVVIFWDSLTNANQAPIIEAMPFAYRLLFGLAIIVYGVFRSWRAYRNYKNDIAAEEEEMN